MLVFVPVIGGELLASGLAGCVVGLLLIAIQRDTFPERHEPQQELKRLTYRLRHPAWARIKRILSID